MSLSLFCITKIIGLQLDPVQHVKEQRRVTKAFTSYVNITANLQQTQSPTRTQQGPDGAEYAQFCLPGDPLKKMHHCFGTKKNCALPPDPHHHHPLSPPRLSVSKSHRLAHSPHQMARYGEAGAGANPPSLSLLFPSVEKKGSEGCSSSPGIQGSLEEKKGFSAAPHLPLPSTTPARRRSIIVSTERVQNA